MKDSIVKKIEELAKKYHHPGNLVDEIGDWSKKELDAFFRDELETPFKQNKDIQVWTLKSIVRTVMLKEESNNPYLVLFK